MNLLACAPVQGYWPAPGSASSRGHQTDFSWPMRLRHLDRVVRRVRGAGAACRRTGRPRRRRARLRGRRLRGRRLLGLREEGRAEADPGRPGRVQRLPRRDRRVDRRRVQGRARRERRRRRRRGGGRAGSGTAAQRAAAKRKARAAKRLARSGSAPRPSLGRPSRSTRATRASSRQGTPRTACPAGAAGADRPRASRRRGRGDRTGQAKPWPGRHPAPCPASRSLAASAALGCGSSPPSRSGRRAPQHVAGPSRSSSWLSRCREPCWWDTPSPARPPLVRGLRGRRPGPAHRRHAALALLDRRPRRHPQGRRSQLTYLAVFAASVAGARLWPAATPVVARALLLAGRGRDRLGAAHPHLPRRAGGVGAGRAPGRAVRLLERPRRRWRP